MNLEFYMDYTGTVQKVLYFKIDLGEWRRFDELTDLEVETIVDHIRRFPLVRTALLHLSRFIAKGKREILRQFIYCNWTALKEPFDISDKKLQFENVPCPFKHSANCPFAGHGIVCVKH
jgi:hypothetical protein